MKKGNDSGVMPLVAIIGRPNVGKSTLFNRLLGARKALVDDEPGLTRDRNYGQMEWRGRLWRIVDTGGFEPRSANELLRAMRAQTERAIAEATAIIFLLDSQEGLLPVDQEVAQLLRRQGKPVFFVVNKIDSPRHESKLVEFYALGVEKLFGISATHGYGIDELLDELWRKVPGAEAEMVAEPEAVVPRVAVLGRPNVGKSTLINALLGEERLLVHHQPGTTRDTVDCEVELEGKKYLFLDTAGLRKKSRIDTRVERFSVMRALESLERAHVVLLVVDAEEGVVDQEAKIAELCQERGRALILLLNKWDKIADKETRRTELDEQMRLRLPHVSWAPVLTISALTGTRLSRIPALLAEVLAQYSKRIGTGELNRQLESWLSAHQPPAPGQKPLRFYYATQIAVRPPSFVFFTNRPQEIPTSYQRYLQNQLRASFGFTGTPLRLFFRSRKGKK